MSKATKIPAQIPNHEGDENQLRGFIAKYKEFFANKAGAILHGEQMLELGAKTSDIQELEQLFFNPIQSLLDARKNIDNNLYQITDRVVCFFIKNNIKEGLISSAVKKLDEGACVFYCINIIYDTITKRE